MRVLALLLALGLVGSGLSACSIPSDEHASATRPSAGPQPGSVGRGTGVWFYTPPPPPKASLEGAKCNALRDKAVEVFKGDPDPTKGPLDAALRELRNPVNQCKVRY